MMDWISELHIPECLDKIDIKYGTAWKQTKEITLDELVPASDPDMKQIIKLRDKTKSQNKHTPGASKRMRFYHDAIKEMLRAGWPLGDISVDLDTSYSVIHKYISTHKDLNYILQRRVRMSPILIREIVEYYKQGKPIDEIAQLVKGHGVNAAKVEQCVDNYIAGILSGEAYQGEVL